MKHFGLLILSLLLGNISVFSQNNYAKVILDSLCSPKYDGRGYVNNGDNRAAEFIIKELEEIGVCPFKKRGFRQHYTLNVNTFPDTVIFVLDDDTLTPGKDYLLNPNSGSAQGVFNIEEVNADNFLDKYKKELQKPIQKNTIYAFNFTTILDRKERNKYKAFAMSAMNFYPIIWVENTKQMYSVGREEKKYPLISIDSAAYGQAKTATLKINNVYHPFYESTNVIGHIPGKKKRKYIVFSAHYDHLGRMGSETYFPGANDNASGVTMLLSLAKYYKKFPPEYTLVFCFFSGEEAGLEGSKYFVQHPFFKLNKIKFVLNIDIMGGASEGITIVNGSKHEKEFNQLVKINSQLNLLKKVKKRGPTSNSDHHFFAEKNVPAFFIYSMGNVKNYHDIYDTSENTPLKKFEEVQRLLIAFVAKL